MSQFGRGNPGVAARAPEALDYRVLVATVQAWQLSTAASRAQVRCGAAPGEAEPSEPSALTRILLGGRDWQQAVLAQGGSFNPLFARCAGGGNEGEERIYQRV